MNILFIFEVDFKSKIVYDMHLLSEAMSMRGHKVYAIDYPNMACQKGKQPKEEIASRAIKGSEVHLIHPWFMKIKGMNRITAFATHYLTIERVIKEKKIDAIVLYSVPTNGLQSVYLANKFNIPIVFRSLDVIHKFVPHSLSSITKELESTVYKGVDKVLTLTPKLSDYVISLGADKDNVEVLPMTVDTQLFNPNVDGSWVRKKFGYSDKDKIILFIGTLYKFSGLEGYLSAFDRVLGDVHNAKLLIVGEGEQKRELESYIKALHLYDYVKIVGFQPYINMPAYINASDICILPFQENEITKDIFPGKIAQYLACGKPVLMTPLKGVKSMIDGESQGVVYSEYFSSDTIKMLLDNDKMKQLGKNGLEYVKEYCDSDKIAGQLENIFEELIKLSDYY
jgi:glycosyltransferase involved in cell wall biosynthesis